MKHNAWAAVAVLVGVALSASPVSAFPKNIPGQECRMDQLQSPGAMRCIDRGANEIAKGVSPEYSHFVVCLADGTRACCAKQADGGYSCGYISDSSGGGGANGSGQATVGGALDPGQSYTPPSGIFHLNPGQKGR